MTAPWGPSFAGARGAPSLPALSSSSPPATSPRNFAAAPAGSSCTFRSFLSICRVRVAAFSIVFARLLELLLRPLEYIAELAKFGFHGPEQRQTSPERFSMARVRNPIWRLLSNAASVVGPVTIIRNVRWSSSVSPGRRSTSA